MRDTAIDRAVDAHLMEYDVLCTRCAYFMNLQFIILTGIVTASSVIISEWYNRLDLLFSWWPILMIQIFSNLSANMFFEQYRIVRYIELTLKPIVVELTGDKRIWGNETGLIKERLQHNLSSATFWENTGIIIIGVLILFTAVYNIGQKTLYHLTVSDIIGFLVNLILFIIYWKRMHGAIKLRTIYK